MKNTKNYYIQKIQEQIEVLTELDQKLKEKYENGEIKYGYILVHGLNNNYTFNWLYGFGADKKQKLYGNPRKRTKLAQYEIQLKMIKEHNAETIAELEKLN